MTSREHPEPVTPSHLAVIIPSIGRETQLRATLRGLREQTELGFETIVVFDGSACELPELEDVTVLRQAQAGPGVARNLGVAATDRPITLFLGDDMVPGPALVAHHLDQHRAHPDLHVAVLGRVAWHRAIKPDRLHRWLEWSGALFDFPATRSEPDADAGWARFYSCNVSIKRELFEAAGGFDPEFEFDYEDLDLAWRLRELGMRLIYEPRAVTEHMHPYDWPAVERRYRSRARAELLMTSKHDWFSPWFYEQMERAEREPRASRAWAMLADMVPACAGWLRARVRTRADRYYRQQLSPIFLSAWAAAQRAGCQRESSAGSSPGGPK